MNIFTLNAGSSSLKAGVYAVGSEGAERCAGWHEDGITPSADGVAAVVSRVAAKAVAGGLPIEAVGHRIVSGGRDDVPALVTPALVERLSQMRSYDPLHMPAALASLAAAQKAFPSLPHVACFDTTFFRDMPPIAQQLPIPTGGDTYLRRYGFHGLSYEYLRTRIGAKLPRRCVFAHLGSGASLAALQDGRPVETTMGFSSMGGIIMASRPGDLDPGVLLYLLEKNGSDVAALRSMLERRSGIAALSGGEGDLHELLGRHGDERAAMAIDSFVRSVAKAIGGLTAVLNGLDLLVFTGGVGEHLAPIRTGVAQALRYLGLEIDEKKNFAAARIISSEASKVDVQVIATDENMTIARSSYDLLS